MMESTTEAVERRRSWAIERCLQAAIAVGVLGVAGGLAAVAVQLAGIKESLDGMPGDATLAAVRDELGEVRRAVAASRPSAASAPYSASLAEGFLSRGREDPVAAAIREQTRQMQEQEAREARRRLLER